MTLETFGNVWRVVAGVAFLYVWVRWSFATKWGKWWDTRALFILFWTIAAVTLFAVAVNIGWIPDSWRPWAAAVVWTLVACSGVFLAVGFEVEQRKANRRRKAKAALTDER